MHKLLALAMLLVASVTPTPGIANPSPSRVITLPAAVPSTRTIVLAGDSITAGGLVDPTQRLDVRLGQRLAGLYANTPGFVQVINRGVGGQALLNGTTVPNLVDTWAADLALLHSGDTIYVQIGTNDLFSYAGDAAWTTAFVSIVNQAWALGIHVIIGQITPISSDHWAVELLRQRLNQWLTDHFGDGMISRSCDVLHNQTTGQTWGDPFIQWSDGIHLKAAAYPLMADLIAQRLIANNWL